MFFVVILWFCCSKTPLKYENTWYSCNTTGAQQTYGSWNTEVPLLSGLSRSLEWNGRWHWEDLTFLSCRSICNMLINYTKAYRLTIWRLSHVISITRLHVRWLLLSVLALVLSWPLLLRSHWMGDIRPILSFRLVWWWTEIVIYWFSFKSHDKRVYWYMNSTLLNDVRLDTQLISFQNMKQWKEIFDYFKAL